ncbi:molybdate-anion transporter [Lingula anatina]|uniref:Molybdate-anion transporter n=1 Tax=Lingula anatina TaxID=7574 RepID=A0A1S3H7U8_LINAN|nr:molybdate-anion transporter [Lingula anatina]XP_013382078.1 molybdate-anion transporter [Lingula anatina]|eukprot:XP_013382077.1 molybdate-anion transporter [Lingula anatina]
MMVITYVSFIILSIGCLALVFWTNKQKNQPPIGNNPSFIKFQNGYFAAYFLALAADWLQGPYLYKLYSHYGFLEDQIAVLYVCGFVSSVLLGTWAPIAADRFGRQKLCLLFTLMYSLACFLKLSRSYGILIIGRVLGGVSNSLLFTAFEAWYVHEHMETHDFPKEWIQVTFAKASMWNGIIAIIAGVVANASTEWLSLGPVSPFMLAVPCLIASGVVVGTQWKENYGTRKIQFMKSFQGGLKVIGTDQRIFLLGTISSLFESVMYIFVFIWTPVLDPGKPSLGITFSSFMVCIMIGNTLYQLLTLKKVTVTNLLATAALLALASSVLCVLSTHPDKTNRNLSFIAFLVMEVAVGLYFPAMTFMRSKIIPEAHHISIMNFFRVPLNFCACFILMMMHDPNFRHGNRLIFVVCTVLMGVCVGAVYSLIALIKNDEELKAKPNDDGSSSVLV